MGYDDWVGVLGGSVRLGCLQGSGLGAFGGPVSLWDGGD